MLEALIVCLDFFLTSSSMENKNVIVRSDGIRCAVKELRGMSEVRITEKAPEKDIETGKRVDSNEENKENKSVQSQTFRISRTQSIGREQNSSVPISNWRRQLLQEQEQSEKKRNE